MFTVAAPIDGSMLDGVPVVRMPDEAEDLFQLLKAMYFPTNIRKGTLMPMSLVVKILGMSTKYMVEFLRRECVEHLCLLFPQTFDGYLKSFDEPLCDVFQEADAIYAVEAGLKFDLLEILPAAFYECCNLSMDQILDGVANGSGAVEVQMSLPALRTCLRGRHKLLAAKRRVTYAFMRQYLKGETGSHCRSAFSNAFLHLLLDDSSASDDEDETGSAEEDNDNDANFRSFEDDVGLLKPDSFRSNYNMPGVCEACCESWKEAEKESLAKIWEKLPEFFGLKWPAPQEAP